MSTSTEIEIEVESLYHIKILIISDDPRNTLPLIYLYANLKHCIILINIKYCM